MNGHQDTQDVPAGRITCRVESHTVKGTFYMVTVDADNLTYACQCRGFSYRHRCSHGPEALDGIGEDVEHFARHGFAAGDCPVCAAEARRAATGRLAWVEEV